MAFKNSTFPTESLTVRNDTTGQSYVYDVSTEAFLWVKIILNGYLVIAMAIIGVIGNILVMIVVYHQGLKETPQILMMSLAASDTILSSVTVVSHVPDIIYVIDYYLSTTILTYNTVYMNVIYVFSLLLGFCTFPLISVERIIAVYFPFHISRICTPFRIKCTLLSLYVYSFAAAINCIFYAVPVWKPIPFSNKSYAVVATTDYLLNNLKILALAQEIILMYLVSIVPLLITTFCCLLIIIKLVQNSRARYSQGKFQARRSRNAQVVRMLLTVCVISCVTSIPTVVIDLFGQNVYLKKGYMSNNYFQLLQTFNNILYQLSPTLNFFIYLIMSSKFAATFNKLFESKMKNKC